MLKRELTGSEAVFSEAILRAIRELEHTYAMAFGLTIWPVPKALDRAKVDLYALQDDLFKRVGWVEDKVA